MVMLNGNVDVFTINLCLPRVIHEDVRTKLIVLTHLHGIMRKVVAVCGVDVQHTISQPVYGEHLESQ